MKLLDVTERFLCEAQHETICEKFFDLFGEAAGLPFFYSRVLFLEEFWPAFVLVNYGRVRYNRLMISEKLIKEASEIAHAHDKDMGKHFAYLTDLAVEKGQELAEKLNADKKIVLLGTLLMDCMLPLAKKKGKLSKHIEMSFKRAEKLLSKFSDITEKEKENVIQCVKQHHGSNKFHSLESEICCNADCHKFASVKGVIGGIENYPEVPSKERVDVLLQKADEKWNALSLDVCKKELEPQYKAIKEFLSLYK